MDDNNTHDDRKRQKTDQGPGNPAGFVPTAELRQRAPASTLHEKVQQFWTEMMQDVCDSGTDLAEFKTAQLPLARIKKIMKSDEDVRMISSETPVLFAKACEFFIIELTLRAWHIAQENNRKTLTKADVAAAVASNEIWDFLADTVPQEDGAELAGGQLQAPGMMAGPYSMQGMPSMPGMPAMPMYQMFVQPGAPEQASGEDEEGEEEE